MKKADRMEVFEAEGDYKKIVIEFDRWLEFNLENKGGTISIRKEVYKEWKKIKERNK